MRTGAGKSTTMRVTLGLDRPTSGTVTVGGRSYQGRVWPLYEVGALLDARAVHPGRSAYDHLHSLAAAKPGTADSSSGTAVRARGRCVAGAAGRGLTIAASAIGHPEMQSGSGETQSAVAWQHDPGDEAVLD